MVIAEPTRRSLRLLALTYSVPFVGFGFCDNAVMLICSDYLDTQFHHVLGLSTLAAAGLGNCVCVGYGELRLSSDISAQLHMLPAYRLAT